MCAGTQTAAVARIKAERSHKLARRTSWRLIRQRDGEHGPKAGRTGRLDTPLRPCRRTDPHRSFHAEIPTNRATTLSRKDWHSAAIGAVLSVNSGRVRALRDPAPPACWPRWGFGGGGATPPGTERRISMSRTAKSKPTEKRRVASSATPVPTSRAAARTSGDPKSKAADAGSKQARIIAMLQSPSGATIAAIIKATGWQPHSVRGFLAGVVRKRLKLTLDSKKVDGTRVYQIAGGESSNPRPRKSTRRPS
jgi:uncharacterized protein DUF3489